MRIAFFVEAFPALSETFILNQITGLIDRGHSLDLFAFGRRDTHGVHADVERYGLVACTHYLNDLPRGLLRRASAATALLTSRSRWLQPREMRTALRILAYRGHKASLNTLSLLHVASVQHASSDYDVVHCQYGTLGRALVSLRRVGILRGKLVTSFRGHDATQQHRTGPGFYDELFREGDMFLPVSQHLKERLIELGCPASKIEVLHSGIDTRRFQYKPRYQLADQPTNVLTIARLVEMKGVSYGIQAVAQLLACGRKVHYRIVGDGPLRGRIEQLIKGLNMGAHVQLLGWKDHEEIVRLMAEAHLLLAPSITAENGEKEGIPNAVKEAMAQGLPIVSTLHSGIPELVVNGVSGFLVPERDPQALSERLEYLCEHPEIWPQMGAAGRRHVEDKFDKERINDRLLELYRR